MPFAQLPLGHLLFGGPLVQSHSQRSGAGDTPRADPDFTSSSHSRCEAFERPRGGVLFTPVPGQGVWGGGPREVPLVVWLSQAERPRSCT